MSSKRAIALSIAGSDSSGGAGIQADLKTFSMFGVYGATAITALTAQNTMAVKGVLATPPDFVTAQIDAVCCELQVGSVKTGMLASADIIEAVAAGIDRHDLVRFILDPVMIATSGAPLIDTGAIAALRERLIPLAELVTPNIPEAARLLDLAPARSTSEMESQARLIQSRFGARAVLVKGGHGEGATSVDVLVAGHDAPAVMLGLPRIATTSSHGTGCTLSAAIAALRVLDVPLEPAVRRAKLFVWNGLTAGAAVGSARGHGGVDHLYALKGHEPPS